MLRKKMNTIAAPGGTRINQELMDRLRSSKTGSKYISTHLQQNPAARFCSSRSPRVPLSVGYHQRAPLFRIHQKTVQDCLFHYGNAQYRRGLLVPGFPVSPLTQTKGAHHG